jgi:hypothetical protein
MDARRLIRHNDRAHSGRAIDVQDENTACARHRVQHGGSPESMSPYPFSRFLQPLPNLWFHLILPNAAKQMFKAGISSSFALYSINELGTMDRQQVLKWPSRQNGNLVFCKLSLQDL